MFPRSSWTEGLVQLGMTGRWWNFWDKGPCRKPLEALEQVGKENCGILILLSFPALQWGEWLALSRVPTMMCRLMFITGLKPVGLHHHDLEPAETFLYSDFVKYLIQRQKKKNWWPHSCTVSSPFSCIWQTLNHQYMYELSDLLERDSGGQAWVTSWEYAYMKHYWGHWCTTLYCRQLDKQHWSQGIRWGRYDKCLGLLGWSRSSSKSIMKLWCPMHRFAMELSPDDHL